MLLGILIGVLIGATICVVLSIIGTKLIESDRVKAYQKENKKLKNEAIFSEFYCNKIMAEIYDLKDQIKLLRAEQKEE